MAQKDLKTDPNKKSGPEPFLNCFRSLSICLWTNKFFEQVITANKQQHLVQSKSSYFGRTAKTLSF